MTGGVNTSALVRLYAPSEGQRRPGIFQGSDLCTDCYNFTSLNASVVEFNISRSGYYSIEDLVNCGDGICEADESCSNCASDCGSCGGDPGTTPPTNNPPRRSSGGTTTEYQINKVSFERGYTRLLKAGLSIKFDLTGNKDYHTVEIIEVRENEVDIEVRSDVQEATLKEGESKEFELDGDNFNDLYVKVEEIQAETGKVILTVKYTHTPYTAPVTTPVTPNATCTDGIRNQGEAGIDCGGPCPA